MLAPVVALSKWYIELSNVAASELGFSPQAMQEAWQDAGVLSASRVCRALAGSLPEKLDAVAAQVHQINFAPLASAPWVCRFGCLH